MRLQIIEQHFFMIFAVEFNLQTLKLLIVKFGKHTFNFQ
jgi:hypothetical protein